VVLNVANLIAQPEVMPFCAVSRWAPSVLRRCCRTLGEVATLTELGYLPFEPPEPDVPLPRAAAVAVVPPLVASFIQICVDHVAGFALDQDLGNRLSGLPKEIDVNFAFGIAKHTQQCDGVLGQSRCSGRQRFSTSIRDSNPASSRPPDRSSAGNPRNTYGWTRRTSGTLLETARRGVQASCADCRITAIIVGDFA